VLFWTGAQIHDWYLSVGPKRRKLGREERAMNPMARCGSPPISIPPAIRCIVRHPRAQSDAHINIKHYVEIAQTASAPNSI